LTITAIVVMAFIVLAIAALIYVPQQRAGSATLKTQKVDLINDSGTVRLDVEVADNEATREHGLMNRTSLATDAGMLFVFDSDWKWSFWMDNTLIPLDMIFVAGNLTIVDIHENAKPMSRDVIVPSAPCRYVLEVNGGLCKAEGINVGDHIKLNA
jgi:uncharacterized membrane protein (UPF0127 family)